MSILQDFVSQSFRFLVKLGDLSLFHLSYPASITVKPGLTITHETFLHNEAKNILYPPLK